MATPNEQHETARGAGGSFGMYSITSTSPTYQIPVKRSVDDILRMPFRADTSLVCIDLCGPQIMLPYDLQRLEHVPGLDLVTAHILRTITCRQKRWDLNELDRELCYV